MLFYCKNLQEQKNYKSIVIYTNYYLLIHLNISLKVAFFPYINIPVRYILDAIHVVPRNPAIKKNMLVKSCQ